MNQELLRRIWQLAGDRCEYCHFPSSNSWLPFQIDHIIAAKHGGLTVESNLALSCYNCNSFKGPNIAGIDPEGDSSTAVQLFHPRHDDWTSHFQWQGASLKGITPKGRATIEVLRINDPDAVDVRRMLIDAGIVL